MEENHCCDCHKEGDFSILDVLVRQYRIQGSSLAFFGSMCYSYKNITKRNRYS